MPLINCKVELKLKWVKYCVLSSNGTDNTDAGHDNIIFTIKDTTLHVSVVILSVKESKIIKTSKPKV